MTLKEQIEFHDSLVNGIVELTGDEKLTERHKKIVIYLCVKHKVSTRFLIEEYELTYKQVYGIANLKYIEDAVMLAPIIAPLISNNDKV